MPSRMTPGAPPVIVNIIVASAAAAAGYDSRVTVAASGLVGTKLRTIVDKIIMLDPSVVVPYGKSLTV